MATRAGRKSVDRDVSLELGRRLFGGLALPDDECWSRIQRWYRAEGYQNQVSFEDLPAQYLEKLLRLAREGIRGDLLVIQSARRKKFTVLVPAHVKRNSTGISDQEIDALNAYLRFRINGIDDSAAPSMLLGKIRWIIEDSPVSNALIESDEFQSSAMNAFPSSVIPHLAAVAKLSIPEARKLTFLQLVLAARAALQAIPSTQQTLLKSGKPSVDELRSTFRQQYQADHPAASTPDTIDAYRKKFPEDAEVSEGAFRQSVHRQKKKSVT